jgi:MFS superfamily sulfate permease-like transporter
MIAVLEAKRAGLFARIHWLPNIVAGLIVGILALPLAMAFAIASGARPEQGIYTAIIGGGLITLLGGSRVQIAGRGHHWQCLWGDTDRFALICFARYDAIANHPLDRSGVHNCDVGRN